MNSRYPACRRRTDVVAGLGARQNFDKVYFHSRRFGFDERAEATGDCQKFCPVPTFVQLQHLIPKYGSLIRRHRPLSHANLGPRLQVFAYCRDTS